MTVKTALSASSVAYLDQAVFRKWVRVFGDIHPSLIVDEQASASFCTQPSSQLNLFRSPCYHSYRGNRRVHVPRRRSKARGL